MSHTFAWQARVAAGLLAELVAQLGWAPEMLHVLACQPCRRAAPRLNQLCAASPAFAAALLPGTGGGHELQVSTGAYSGASPPSADRRATLSFHLPRLAGCDTAICPLTQELSLEAVPGQHRLVSDACSAAKRPTEAHLWDPLLLSLTQHVSHQLAACVEQRDAAQGSPQSAAQQGVPTRGALPAEALQALLQLLTAWRVDGSEAGWQQAPLQLSNHLHSLQSTLDTALSLHLQLTASGQPGVMSPEAFQVCSGSALACPSLLTAVRTAHADADRLMQHWFAYRVYHDSILTNTTRLGCRLGAS